LTVRQLDSQEKEQVQTTGTLVVEDVTGPAAAAGVQPGDIILGINGKRVKTSKELQDAAKASGKNVALLIQRDDAQIFVPLRIQ
jgi:serine protease Do